MVDTVGWKLWGGGWDHQLVPYPHRWHRPRNRPRRPDEQFQPSQDQRLRRRAPGGEIPRRGSPQVTPKIAQVVIVVLVLDFPDL